MATYKTAAINLRSRPTGEADKILTLFSRDKGKIKVIAKSARRTSSKFGGRLEVFAYNNYFIADTKGLDIVSQCETIEDFREIRKSSDKLETALYFVKIIEEGTSEGVSNSELFDLLLNALLKLKKGANPKSVRKIFEVEFMKIEGIFRSTHTPQELISEHLNRDIAAW